jgi:GT2 family glycosyltransferase
LFYFQEKMKTGNIFWHLLGKFYFGYLLEGKAFSIGKFFKSGAFSVGANYDNFLKFNKCIEVDHLEGCNLAVRHGLLKRIGGFDPIFTGVAEYNDADAAYKIRKLGYKILFNPKAKIFHLPSKTGAYKERVNSYSRMINFIIFYFRHIKPDNFDKFIRFSAYLFFLNGYYTYRFFTTWNFGYLQSVPATFIGFFQNAFKKNSMYYFIIFI